MESEAQFERNNRELPVTDFLKELDEYDESLPVGYREKYKGTGIHGTIEYIPMGEEALPWIKYFQQEIELDNKPVAPDELKDVLTAYSLALNWAERFNVNSEDLKSLTADDLEEIVSSMEALEKHLKNRSSYASSKFRGKKLVYDVLEAIIQKTRERIEEIWMEL